MKKFTRLSNLVLLATAFASASVFAEEVLGDKSPWAGGAELSANISTGNTDIQTLGATAFVDYRASLLNTTLKAGFLRNRTDGKERNRDIRSSLRTGMNVTDHLDFFGLGQYNENKFRGLDKQWLAELGLGLYAFNNDMHSLRLEGGAGFLTENYFPTTLNPYFRTFGIYTGGLAYRLKISEIADLTDDVLMINNFKNSTDWRIQNVAALSSRMTSILSLKLSYSTEYRHVAIPGYKHADNITAAAIVAKF
ncbi:MAG: DUF481 domain-containing protein [Cryobacterium sp.]|nr:DUF481 domain-containing protein [Oligoflexia bacterium]